MKHIHPLPRIKQKPALVFTTTTIGGAKVSSWQESKPSGPIFTGTSGRIGEIITAMHRGAGVQFKNPQWTPPYYYEEYAKSALPECERDEYIVKCKKWMDAHPVKVFKPEEPQPIINSELICKLYKKYKPKVPPIEELESVWRDSGVPEYRIQKALIKHQKNLDTFAERTAEIDKKFGIYPVSKKKKDTQIEPKIIKVVKKKLIV